MTGAMNTGVNWQVVEKKPTVRGRIRQSSE